MALKYHGKISKFKLDGAAAGGVQDISFALNSVKFSRDPDRPKAPTFGDLAERFPTLGLFANQVSLGGYFEPTASQKIHGKVSAILQDQYALSSYLSSGKISRKIGFGKNPTFGDVALRYGTVPLMSAAFSVHGYPDYSASAVDSIMRAAMVIDPQVTAFPIVTVGLNGFAIGAQVEMFQAVPSKYDIDTGEEKDIEFDVDYAVDDVVDLGVSLHDLVAETTAGTVNYAGVDETAVSTAIVTVNAVPNAVAHLHVTAYAGWTNATVKIQDSADNSTFADIGMAFTAVTAPGKQRITLPSGTTIRRYVRAVVTFVGASGSMTFQVSFARRGATYGTPGTHRHFASLMGGYIFSNNGPTAFEFGPLGIVATNPKHSGSARISDYSIDFGEEKDTTFSMTGMVDGQITDGTY